MACVAVEYHGESCYIYLFDWGRVCMTLCDVFTVIIICTQHVARTLVCLPVLVGVGRGQGEKNPTS